eukprot:TRINITY_DN589_c0_g1_i18.p1 TRINITY_DN589_c0_g1~~TRINITY_DN589_c0_g1_i18.p1  ORF type:complete len:210 (-),score=29.57 TRINITY_DN589_c0_g1_i18:143-772(-)
MELLDYARLSQDVLNEINIARHIPNVFITELVNRYQFFDELIYRNPDGYAIETYEGDKALTDAIDALKEQTPLPVLIANKGLQRVALDYAENLIQSGDFTCPHIDTADTTPAQRISKVVRWTRMAGECIAVGEVTAIDIVASLIIDDGNDEKSNRRVLLDKDARIAGVVCVPHSVFGVISVIDVIGGEYEAQSNFEYSENAKGCYEIIY